MSSKVQSILVIWHRPSALVYVIICGLGLISALLLVRLDGGPCLGHQVLGFVHLLGLGSQVFVNITAEAGKDNATTDQV